MLHMALNNILCKYIDNKLTTFSPPSVSRGFLKLNGGILRRLFTSRANAGYEGDGEGATAI